MRYIWSRSATTAEMNLVLNYYIEDSIQNEAPIQQDSQNFSNNVLLSQMISLTSRVIDMETRLVSELSATKRKLTNAVGALDASVKPLAFQPAIAVRSGNKGHLQQKFHAPKRALLSKAPRDLYRLWDEYEFGLYGRKAARRFTPEERG